MIDPSTYLRFHQAVERARHDGLALGDLLDRQRLLATEHHLRTWKLDALRQLFGELSRTPPVELVHRYQYGLDPTPAGMHAAILSWMADRINLLEKGDPT
jgi:hypothetical protein